MTSSAFFKPASSTRHVDEAQGATSRSGQNGRRGEIRWPPMGRSGGHHWGVSMAAYGEVLMAAVSTSLISRPCFDAKSSRAETGLQLPPRAIGSPHLPEAHSPDRTSWKSNRPAGFQLRSERPSVATLTGILPIALGPVQAIVF